MGAATATAPQSNLPPTTVPVLDNTNQFTLPWRLTLQDMSRATASSLTPAQVEAMIAADLVPIQTEIDALQAQIDGLDTGQNILGYLAVAELDGYGG